AARARDARLAVGRALPLRARAERAQAERGRRGGGGDRYARLETEGDHDLWRHGRRGGRGLCRPPADRHARHGGRHADLPPGLLVTAFGGAATCWGPVIGSLILIPLAEILHAELGHRIPGIQGVVFGLAIVLVIVLAPEGVLPRIRDRLARRREPSAAPLPAPPPVRSRTPAPRRPPPPG